MSHTEEFLTIKVLRESDAETRGVDCFALSLIKAERQIRKLVTHLVYQNDAFQGSDIQELKNALAKNRKVYFEGNISGFNEIYPKSVIELIGSEYDELLSKVKESIKHRNKIFHGQLTNKHLSRDNLFEFVDHISTWCFKLAEGAEKEIGYDGFSRNSFQKSGNSEISNKFKVTFQTVSDYESFIQAKMAR